MMSVIVSIKENSGKDVYVVEVDAGRGNWLPSSGEAFFVPNLVSMSKPVIEFDWTNSASDYRLASMRMVHKTYDEAFQHYHAQVQLQAMLVI